MGGRRSCFRGCRLCGSLLCGCSRSRRCSGLFFHALAGSRRLRGRRSSALRLRGCRVVFRSFRIIFLRFLFGAVGRIGLTLPQQSRRLHRQTRRLGRQQGCGAKTTHRDGKRHHRRGHHLARRTARLLFWCSCIVLSHSACAASKLYSNAASRRQKYFKCHLYVYSIHPTPSSRQCPSVSRAGRFVEVFHHRRRFMWKTNQAAVLLHPKEKKMSSERDFCVFLLLS